MSISVKHSEEETIALLQKKDEQAFAYLYENYSGAILGVIQKIISIQSLAEDTLQDTFVKIWKGIDSYDSSKGRLFTWMIKIARNTSLDVVKSKDFKNSRKNQEMSDFVYDFKQDNSTARHLDSVGLKSVINKLKEDFRVIIDMAYYQGYTQVEIAEHLNIPLGTVKTRARNALMALKQVL